MLFGSYARGDYREHSDLDVAVVFGGARRAGGIVHNVPPAVHEADLGRRRVERGHLRRELAGQPLVVVVEQRHVLAARALDAGVQRPRLSLPASVPERADPRIAAARHHAGRIVRRVVVDHDDFEVAERLRQYAGQGAGQQRGAVARGDDDGNPGHGDASLGSPRS